MAAVHRALLTFWNQRAVTPRLGPARRDRWLVVAVWVAAAIELALRSDVGLPAMSLAVVWAMALLLPWRRRHPWPTALAALGLVCAGELVSLIVGTPWEGLVTGGILLIFPYAAFRWGAGRQAAAVQAAAYAVGTASMFATAAGPGDVIGGYVVLTFPAVLGIAVRAQAGMRRAAVEEARLREREDLARELHDSVAHHVAVIAVQAQAGRAVAPTRPEKAVEVLAVIEEEASRTLEEMRAIVGSLRDDAAAMAPAPGVADLAGLEGQAPGAPRVEVSVTGDAAALSAPVDTAVFRVAREAVTNALRHARDATLVRVRVDVGPSQVRLTVDDDGGPAGARPDNGQGFGLVGMRERVAILGGTVTAGPGEGGGWTVAASLPRVTPGAGPWNRAEVGR